MGRVTDQKHQICDSPLGSAVAGPHVGAGRVVKLNHPATVTVDPDLVLLTGRMRPLMRYVLPDIRARLDHMLPKVPNLVITSTVRFSTAHGAAAVTGRTRVAELLSQVNGTA